MTTVKSKIVDQKGHPASDESMLPLWLRMEREYNLRLQQWDMPINVTIALLKLHLHPNITEPAALAAASCLPRQTMTFVLDALEKRGLASRTPHPVDRRRKNIQLSAKGQTLAISIYQELVRFESAALKAIGDKERPTLRRLVARYTDMLAAENANLDNL